MSNLCPTLRGLVIFRKKNEVQNMLQILKNISNNFRLNYYLSTYFKELKRAADSPYETMKEFVIKMGSPALSKVFEITREIQLNKFNIDITHEQFLDIFYRSNTNNLETKYWVINKYGINTWELFLRAAGVELDDKTSEIVNKDKSQEDCSINNDHATEIQKYLRDLGCSFTSTGYIAAMALKKDRSALDHAISFCVGAIAENYSKNLMQLVIDGQHTHLKSSSGKIKNYYENNQISKLAYQSSISTIGSCLNPNKTDEEKSLLESLIKQNYLGNEKLVFISEQ